MEIWAGKLPAAALCQHRRPGPAWKQEPSLRAIGPESRAPPVRFSGWRLSGYESHTARLRHLPLPGTHWAWPSVAWESNAPAECSRTYSKKKICCEDLHPPFYLICHLNLVKSNSYVNIFCYLVSRSRTLKDWEKWLVGKCWTFFMFRTALVVFPIITVVNPYSIDMAMKVFKSLIRNFATYCILTITSARFLRFEWFVLLKFLNEQKHCPL